MIEKLEETGIDGYGYTDENGYMYESPSSYLQIEYLGFCGCGNPDEVMKYLEKKFTLLENKDWGSYEDLDYMFFVYWANNKGFAEHGTAARCSWLTPIGKELLADMRTLLEDKDAKQ